MSLQSMIVTTSSAHVFAVAGRYDLLVTIEGHQIRTEREIPGGSLVYVAQLRERVAA